MINCHSWYHSSDKIKVRESQSQIIFQTGMSGKLPKVSVIGGESDKISIKFFMTFITIVMMMN